MLNTDKKILVYVGLNRGNSFYSMIKDFDIIVGLEPIPQLCLQVFENVKRFNFVGKEINIFNCAASDYEGVSKFYLSSNDYASSSLSIWENDITKNVWPHVKQVDEIEVKVRRLDNILKKLNISHIDYLLTDTQGSDFTILTTLKNFIDNKQIKHIQTENSAKTLYNNLKNNFSDMQKLLNKNYNLIKIQCDSENIDINDVDNHTDFDSFWSVKN